MHAAQRGPSVVDRFVQARLTLYGGPRHDLPPPASHWPVPNARAVCAWEAPPASHRRLFCARGAPSLRWQWHVALGRVEQPDDAAVVQVARGQGVRPSESHGLCKSSDGGGGGNVVRDNVLGPLAWSFAASCRTWCSSYWWLQGSAHQGARHREDRWWSTRAPRPNAWCLPTRARPRRKA